VDEEEEGDGSDAEIGIDIQSNGRLS